jgi:hypothetical protein
VDRKKGDCLNTSGLKSKAAAELSAVPNLIAPPELMKF